MIRLSCSFDSSIGRHHLPDYVREVQFDVCSIDAFENTVEVAGFAACKQGSLDLA